MGFGRKFVVWTMLVCFIGLSGISLAQPDCISCHGEVRHGQQNNTYCINCHVNYGLDGNEHVNVNLTLFPDVHRAFDWKADNQEAPELFEEESCPVCHVDIHGMISARVDPTLFRICEDCHLEDGIGPVPGSPGWNLRSDIDDFIPKIYAHYSGAGSMNVPDQSGIKNGQSISSCFDYNVNTGEGTCHGVGRMFSDEAGGYFALINKSTISRVTGLYNRQSDPYQLAVITDNMPDTTDCMFCHYQENESIRMIWGGAREPTSEPHLNLTGNPDCWNCHTRDNSKPRNFHAATMGREPKKELPWILMGAAGASLLIIGGAAYYFMVLKKK